MKFLLPIIIISLIAIGFIFTTSQNKTPSLQQPATSTQKEEGTVVTGYEGKVLAGNTSPLLDFVKADYDKALLENKIILLYFYADWCPICRVEAPNELYPAFDELTNAGVIGFRVNYNDSNTDEDEKALAKQFGITYQHTKVILKNGIEAVKSMETWDKEQYLQEINKAIAQ